MDYMGLTGNSKRLGYIKSQAGLKLTYIWEKEVCARWENVVMDQELGFAPQDAYTQNCATGVHSLVKGGHRAAEHEVRIPVSPKIHRRGWRPGQKIKRKHGLHHRSWPHQDDTDVRDQGQTACREGTGQEYLPQEHSKQQPLPTKRGKRETKPRRGRGELPMINRCLLSALEAMKPKGKITLEKTTKHPHRQTWHLIEWFGP